MHAVSHMGPCMRVPNMCACSLPAICKRARCHAGLLYHVWMSAFNSPAAVGLQDSELQSLTPGVLSSSLAVVQALASLPNEHDMRVPAGI